MRNANIIFLSVMALALSSCAFQPLYIENVEKPKMEDINLSNSDVRFNVVIKNPNHVGFRLVKSDIDIKVNSMDIGSINLSKKMKVSPNSSTSIPVVVKIDNTKLLSIGAMSLFSEPKVRLEGYIKGRKFLFPKRYKVNFEDSFSISDFIDP